MRVPLIAAVVAASTMTVLAAPALARQGCGPGFHRVYNGACVSTRAGRFYRGYGWWDGRRYWQSRYRFHGGWRYR